MKSSFFRWCLICKARCSRAPGRTARRSVARGATVVQASSLRSAFDQQRLSEAGFQRVQGFLSQQLSINQVESSRDDLLLDG
jgi:hypothetical protein